jgi:LysM repeat protein/ABC-type branched-subunit amino acid transport system substrate-binding protein
MKPRLIILFLGILFSSAVFAQDVTISKVIEKIDGKEYYIHTVVKGESVWKIAKAYGVTSDEIIADNPTAKKKIKPGQKLKIIYKGDPLVPVAKYYDHTVIKGESLYTIAKKYSITVDEIKKANPGISEVIKIGQIIKIPANAVLVAQSDTLTLQQKDSIKADSVDKYDCTSPKLLDSYNVALMIPFYLDNMYEIKTDDPDIKEKDANDLTPFTFVQFYEGALMAIDSLKKSGLNAKIYVYDVQNDSAVTRKILEKPEFQKMNLIIGPFFEKSLKVVSDYAKKNKIYLIDPVSTEDTLLTNNPYVINSSPTIEMQLKQVAAYIVGRYPGSPIVVVHTNKESEKTYVDIIGKAIRDEEKKAGLKDSSFRPVVYGTAGISGITKNFDVSDTNIVVTLSNGEVFLSNYVRGLSTVADNYKMIVFGLPSWKNYDQIETEYFLEMYLHMFSSSFVDYEDENVLRFVKKYREEYKTEPEKYAFMGFDITTYFLTALMKYGTSLGKCLDKIPAETYLQTSFNFVRDNKKNGLQNSFLNIYRYERYQLVDVRKHPTIKEIEKDK